jgi:hypothetical protein
MTLAPHTSLDHVDFGIPSNGLPLFAQLRDLTIPLRHISTFRILQFASNLSILSLSSIRLGALREVLSIMEYSHQGIESFNNSKPASETRADFHCTTPEDIPSQLLHYGSCEYMGGPLQSLASNWSTP